MLCPLPAGTQVRVDEGQLRALTHAPGSVVPCSLASRTAHPSLTAHPSHRALGTHRKTQARGSGQPTDKWLPHPRPQLPGSKEGKEAWRRWSISKDPGQFQHPMDL